MKAETVIRIIKNEIKESYALAKQETPGSPEACGHEGYADGLEAALALFQKVETTLHYSGTEMGRANPNPKSNLKPRKK